ncbi:flavin-containing monooxygenase [Sphingomonas sp. SRS2]|uniref:flavin-containing monooxygenase n=1 Tax=Sphingomonas sp. SRS2 TaxID=133190 RepID=UPI000697A4B4|nr:NAD(P)/FAD-dependent oxidoreductase [Sphingomonas sp. SRS2]
MSVLEELSAEDQRAVEAIDGADVNVLRLALLQITGDAALAGMKVVKTPARGGVLEADTLAVEHHAEVRRAALDYIRKSRISSAETPPPPSREKAYELMKTFSAGDISPEELRFGYEELAFEDFPRQVNWQGKPPADVIADFEVLIIGAGISGVALGVTLNQLGIPYTILERHEGLGGTWWINDYPDCRVDITSYSYQFKFEKKYPWSEYYSSRDETLKYVQHVADKHDIASHVNFGSEVVSATWVEAEAKWHVATKDAHGVERIWVANVLISAAGLFATPKLPEIAGIETFEGAIFHTTQWDHDFDYRGKKVGLIGNGSTGSQLMPGIAQAASELTIFQRTAQWVMPAENYRDALPADVSWLIENIPFYWNWLCYSTFSTTCRLQELQEYDRAWQANGGTISQRNDKLRANLLKYIESKVGDAPELHNKLLPRFAPLGRRSVVDNGWYEALRRENVTLSTENITRITPKGIETSDGKHHDLDMLILAAGFHASRYLWPIKYVGRDGVTLEEVWAKDGPRSYLGMTLPGFPNFFIMYGPNGQPRAGGFFSWAEIWTRYILALITKMIESRSSSVEVRREVFDDYNREMDEEMKNLIWENEAKGSYFLNEFGRMAINLPWRAEKYHAMVESPDLADFELR